MDLDLDDLLQRNAIDACSAIWITPAIAKAMLTRNKDNRNLRQGRVNNFAELIKRRAWTLVPDAIAFDQSGTLINGQHRLHACIKADLPFQAFVVQNMPPGAFANTDQHAKRTLADATRIESKQAVLLKAYIDLVLKEKNMPPIRAAQLYHEIASDLEYLSEIRPHERGTGQAGAWAAMLCYVRDRQKNRNAVFEFARDLTRSISEIPQAQLLRNWLYSTTGRGGSRARTEIFERTLYCLHAYIECRHITQVRTLTIAKVQH